jgi:dCMP deaminase
MENTIRKKKDIKFLQQAFEYAKKSNAEKRKVGCIIDFDMVENYYGYNQMFPELKKQNCENSIGNSYECVIHAEELAIISMLKENDEETIREANPTIYVTYSPCMNCCKLIVHSGISRLVYCEEHPKNFTTSEIDDGYSPLLFLTECGIEVVRIPYEEVFSDKFKSLSKTLVFHNNDGNGFMSYYLINFYINGLNIIESCHNITKDDYHKYDKFYICDYNFDKELIDNLSQYGDIKFFINDYSVYNTIFELSDYNENISSFNLGNYIKNNDIKLKEYDEKIIQVLKLNFHKNYHSLIRNLKSKNKFDDTDIVLFQQLNEIESYTDFLNYINIPNMKIIENCLNESVLRYKEYNHEIFMKYKRFFVKNNILFINDLINILTIKSSLINIPHISAIIGFIYCQDNAYCLIKFNVFFIDDSFKFDFKKLIHFTFSQNEIKINNQNNIEFVLDYTKGEKLIENPTDFFNNLK